MYVCLIKSKDNTDIWVLFLVVLLMLQLVYLFLHWSNYSDGLFISMFVAAYHLAAEPILCRRKGTMFDLTAGCKAALFSAYSLKQ